MRLVRMSQHGLDRHHVIRSSPATRRSQMQSGHNAERKAWGEGRDKVGKVSRSQLEEIAKAKMPDLSAYDMDQAVRIIAGSARSMGIETEGV